MRFHSVVSLLSLSLGLGFALFACGSSNSVNPPADGGGGGDSSVDGGGGDGGSSSKLSFKPSNVDLSGWDLSQIGDVDLSGTNCIVEDEQPDGMVPFLCDAVFENHVAHKIVTLADQSKISVYVMKSLRIEPSTVLSLSRGHLPIVLVTTGSMELLGSVQADPGLVGGYFNTGSLLNAKGVGPGGGTAGDTTGLSGGGASYCGLGGKGGTFTGGTASMAPAAGYGTPQLVPLVGGSAGGNGALTNDTGAGGGAVQLVAGTTFNLHTGGFISAGGGGGVFGGLSTQGSGGGGSGGSILIEAPSVTIDGNIGANGGGGGQGNGDTGDVARADVVAKGGHKIGGSQNGPGGDGSFGANANGGDGPSSTAVSASSGGGGAGRVRINTESGAATITGAISPAASTPCFTQGKIAK